MLRFVVAGMVVIVLGVAGASGLLFLQGSTGAQASTVVQLRQGWNLMVWTADSQPVGTALSDIGDELVIAYGWQGDSQAFSRYVPGRPDVSTMTQVQKDSGYWLLMTRDVAFDIPTADGQQCPTPYADCDECESALDECTTDYAECVDDYDQCGDDYSQCLDDYGDCTDSLGCWTDCRSDGMACWSDCYHLVADCVFSASTLNGAKGCFAFALCDQCDDTWDCSWCD